MNKLPIEKRVQALNMLVEGSSMRSIERVVGVNINTVMKLLVDAGETCLAYHNEAVRDVHARHIQCDEIWSFCYSKQKNADRATGVIDVAGDVWTWTGIDSDTKLIVSWLVGGRDAEYAIEFMDDLRGRLANRVQLSTDGYGAYLDAVEGAFGGSIDYAQLIKVYGQPSDEDGRRYSPAQCLSVRKREISGAPNMAEVNTSYVERHNLTMRMSMRRFTRLTNAFSKKVQNHIYSVALYTVWFNFVRPHSSLKGETPAQAAGLAAGRLTMRQLVDRIDSRAPKAKRGPYKTNKK
jgi:IS1 family transposase